MVTSGQKNGEVKNDLDLYHGPGEYAIQIGWRGVHYFSITCTAMTWSSYDQIELKLERVGMIWGDQVFLKRLR